MEVKQIFHCGNIGQPDKRHSKIKGQYNGHLVGSDISKIIGNFCDQLVNRFSTYKKI